MESNIKIAFIWIVIILIAATTGIAMQPYITENVIVDTNEFTIDERIIEVEYVEIREITTDDILQSNSFDTWSIEDKELLTIMMAVTVNPSYSDELFIEIIKDAPDHVLETYIDLLEHAGY